MARPQKKLPSQSEKWHENAKKDPKKDPQNVVSPSLAAQKCLTGNKKFHRPKFAQNKISFHRDDLQGWPY